MEELVRFTSKKLLNEHNSVSQCLVSCTMWATKLVLPLGTLGLILPCLHCSGDSAYEAWWKDFCVVQEKQKGLLLPPQSPQAPQLDKGKHAIPFRHVLHSRPVPPNTSISTLPYLTDHTSKAGRQHPAVGRFTWTCRVLCNSCLR